MKVAGLQQLIKVEAELQKEIKAEIRHAEELKAIEKNSDEKTMRMLKGDFEGLELEDVKSVYDKLAAIQSIIKK
jgi:hypothetical protein